MADKKPKIDLKARLGKKTVAGPATGAVPPPVGIPKPTGVPVPPFAAKPSASRPSAAPAPRVDASDPYAAISADQAPERNEPQAIKVEMSEEIVQAQKKGKGRIIALAIATAIVGGALGFAVGSGVERGKGADKAIEGASSLIEEVNAANAKAIELQEVLDKAGKKLGENKFPAEEVSKLGELDIPFAGANLTGKGIGRFKPIVVTQLVQYAGAAAAANDQREKLQAVLAGSKKAIEEILAQKTKPKVYWSVYVRGGPHGPWAVMQPLPKPFIQSQKEKVKDKDGKEKAYSWPDEFKVKDGGKSFDLKRYTGGDPGKDNPPKLIPVDPATQKDVCPNDTNLKLRREVNALLTILKGKGGTDPEPGLKDTGEKIVEQLKQIGQR